MSIDQKYFKHDKNHLLKTVQAFSKETLLLGWTEEAFNGFMNIENPLGLEDDFTLELKEEISNGAYILMDVYDLIAAIYRFRHSDNQLSFMWDGRTHMEYYDSEWRVSFTQWVSQLCRQRDVYRVIIKAALAGNNVNTEFLSASLKRTILKHFEIKLTRSQRLYALSA